MRKDKEHLGAWNGQGAYWWKRFRPPPLIQRGDNRRIRSKEESSRSARRKDSGFAIVPGPHGILDAVCAVGSARDCVSFAGFPLRLVDTDPLEFLSGFQVRTTIAEGNGYRTELLKDGKKHWVSMAVIDREEGVELVWDSDLRITDLTTGRFDREASEIYAGVGNVIRDPLAPFDLHADGHQLATRHIGLRFGDSLNLLVACSKPPDKLSVNPSSREYCLHSHLAGSFFLVPSTESAFDTVTKYRRVANFPKAPGVQQLAGRFTFDLWWGSLPCHRRQTGDGGEVRFDRQCGRLP